METQERTHSADIASFLAALVLSSHEAIEGLTLDGNVIFWNKGSEELYGYSSKEIVGKSIFTLYPDDRNDQFQMLISKIKNGESIEAFITQRKRKESPLIEVVMSLSPINKNGTLVGISAISRPFVGEERIAHYTRSLIEASLDPLVTISITGKIMDVNEAMIKVTGSSRKELLATDFSNYFTDPKKAHRGYKQIFEKGYVTDYPLTIRHKEGRLTDVFYNASTYKDEKGNILGALATAHDVTNALQDYRHARSLIEASLDPFVTISPEGKITDVNEATTKATGIPREKLIGSDFSNYFTEPEKAREGYRLVFSKGKVIDYPLTIRHTMGHTMDVLYNASVYKDERGNVLGVFAAARDITDRKLTEESFQKILEATPDAIVMIDQDGKIIYINAQTAKLFGYEKEELIGQQVEILIPEPYRSRHPDHRRYFFKNPRSRVMGSGMTLYGQRKNKEIFSVEISISPLETKEGLLGLAAIRDITVQKQAYQYARSLIEASLDPLVTINPEGKITDVNEATVKVTGVNRESLIGSDFSNYFTEPEEAREGYKLVFKEGFVRDYPLAIRHISGTVTNVVYNASVYKDINGEDLGVFAAARDITQRKKAEEQQHASSAYARSLIESSLDPLVTISPEGKITDVNHATELVTGVMREWLIGSDFSNYFTEPRKAREGYRRVLKKGSVRDYSLAIRHATGKIVDVAYNGTVYRDATGKVQGVFASARDVTESKKTSQYARSLIEASLDPLVTISPEGKITDVNEATVKVTGLERDKLIGTEFSIYFTEPQKARTGYEEAFQKGFLKDYPLTIRHRDGKLTDVLYNTSTYKDKDGNVLGVFAAARDYSRVKQTTEKLESSNQELDAFTYSVAHDLKAPLRAIDGFSKILREDYQETLDAEGKRLIETICSNTEKMGKLIEDLLALSHIGRYEIKKENTNMSQLVNSVFNELIVAVPDREILLDLKELPNNKVDQALMHQVWVNLISNAIKFTQIKKKALIEIGGSSDERHYVKYYIKDNGLGFDMKYADKLFGVFQRLHGSEIEGTGIGLANIRRIVKRHGGEVWGEGKIGEGATFYFTLPKE